MKDNITQEQAKKIFRSQKNLLDYGIQASITADSPYINVLEKGTFPDALAVQLFTVVPNRIRQDGGIDQYIFNSKIKVSKGTPIKIGTLPVFASDLQGQFQATQQIVTECINSNIRAELFTRSGVKAVVRSGVSATAMIAGGYNQIDTAVPAIESDARLNPILLHKFARFMRENLKVTPFGSGANTNLRFIGGWDINNALRNDLGVIESNPFKHLVVKGEKMALGCTERYVFTHTKSGIELGVDTDPMRYNMSKSGPVFVEPEIIVDDPIRGKVRRPNPVYDEASHEVGFLIGKGSFEFQVPKGKEYKNGVKTEFNVSKRSGVITASIATAIRPIYPWFVMPILYKR